MCGVKRLVGEYSNELLNKLNGLDELKEYN